MFDFSSTSTIGKEKARICVVDVGLVATLSQKDRENFLEVFASFLTGDGKKGAELFIDRSPGSHTIDPQDRENFIAETEALLASALKTNLTEIPMGETLYTMLDIARKYHVKLEHNFVTLVTSILTIEGVARQLDSDFNLQKETLSWIIKTPGVFDRLSKFSSSPALRKLLFESL